MTADSISLRDRSTKTLQALLSVIEKNSGENQEKLPNWVAEQTHAKIFEVSEKLADPLYNDSLLHEDSELLKQLSILNGYLNVLKFIEESR